MNNHTSPLSFSTLRRFHVLTGTGVVVAVFFQPSNTTSDQKANACTNQQCRQRKPQGLRSV